MMEKSLQEEELKNTVGSKLFANFNTDKIIGKIDFCVSEPETSGQPTLFGEENTISYLWAEAKRGTHHDIYESFIQLILTIGKAREFDKHMPPPFLGAFDAEKIAFVQYNKIMQVFYQNDFNWNVTPSDHATKEFRQLKDLLIDTLEREKFIFNYKNDKAELEEFIKKNLVKGSPEKIQVDKNNFISVYGKWRKEVMPYIGVNWEQAKRNNIFSGDFFLADLINSDDETILENLDVRFKGGMFLYQRSIDDTMGDEISRTAQFKEGGKKAHKEFWRKYARPPKEEYWNTFIKRKDLLVPEDIRERKGSFFTPGKWRELSQKYIADVLGDNWQEKYYIWDCCAGTGNLLKDFSEPERIFASTLDKGDVGIMKELAARNILPLMENQIFQFDFLNDDLKDKKVPEKLRKILADENERKKLVIYINPPYAEHSTTKTKMGTGQNKTRVAKDNLTYKEYSPIIGTAARELFAQFIFRIYKEIPNCIIGNFSTLKILNAQNFEKFRSYFLAKLKSLFIIPANTFDNVTGEFPIGFFIWNTGEKENFSKIEADVFDKDATFYGKKDFFITEKKRFVINWLRNFYDSKAERIAYLRMQGTDFQNNQGCFFTTTPSENDIKEHLTTDITKNNVIPMCIYFSVRQCIEHTWINHNDQFLFPNDDWKTDYEFQADCLAFTLFHGKNRISSMCGETNNWIPFRASECGSKNSFESTFMSDFLRGKLKPKEGAEQGEFEGMANETPVTYNGTQKVEFSSEAQAVMDSGLELWKYYFSSGAKNANASFYDIRLHFQGSAFGKDGKERMNNTSTDEKYNALIADLRSKRKALARKIEGKVYEHGFLK